MVQAEKIKKVAIDDEMKEAYLDYAMSVIVGRALPDVRDGLKPVHKRILYALKDLGITSSSSHKKSARIVGEVLGKYHPHGDTAVYDTLVRMAQDFSYRYPLVDGHGNFGSVDGDSAAAMRYTEARMASIADEMLRDIDKDTVDFRPNFDDTLEEPEVLPSRVPNLLVNGSAGIAVGMATSIPPHNLSEVIDALVKMIEESNVGVDDLMNCISGPDFPTGGFIMNRDEVIKAYHTGRGRIRLRARTRLEEEDSDSPVIIVEELPYKVNKARLIEKIAELVKNEEIEGIRDLRDESDREGMRIVIECKRGVNPDILLNKLYKNTQLLITYSIIMLALVDGEPRVLSLKEILHHYLEHQKNVVRRRTSYDLKKAESRAHLLAGYRIALDAIDDVVDLIKQAPDSDTARQELIASYGLSEKQAEAILNMQLKRLTALERDKIDDEYRELQETIAYLRSILASEEKLMEVIKEELLEIKDKFGDERRTTILNQEVSLEMEDLIEEEKIVVAFTHYGYIKRMPLDLYRSQHRGGKGIIGMSTREQDFVENIFATTTHHTFLFFTNQGQVYRLKGYQIPEASRQSRGTAVVNLLKLEEGERITAVIPVQDFSSSARLIMATRQGLIKKTDLEAYNTNYTGLKGIRLREEDELIAVRLLEDGEQAERAADSETAADTGAEVDTWASADSGTEAVSREPEGDLVLPNETMVSGKGALPGNNGKPEDIMIVSRLGQAIRFSAAEVRSTSRNSMGVKAIDLAEEDEVIGMGTISSGQDLFVITEQGYGKRTSLEEYRPQNRGGKGLKTARITSRNGPLAAMKIVQPGVGQELFVITRDGIMIRLEVDEISCYSRNTQGVKIITLSEGDQVVSLASVIMDDEGEAAEEEGEEGEAAENQEEEVSADIDSGKEDNEDQEIIEEE